ncbi:MAG: FTR1 family protein [Gordonia sp. (in: high G+C Gram-positive bacteria)]|uniref:iron uptake transporter permease EfeU n=1 Tax=Gordonia sp. (in: high G+C Gram-positive bacteria) TaxID=84139 RepID=UPI0039E557CE
MQGIFFATLLIGLREGLEATLIVSIVGAYLKRNGQSLRPMLLGVGAAILISIAVGVGLDLASAALPQRQQEMLETVIGVVAVIFVTSMIVWMNNNSFKMKGELESEAAEALKTGGYAMVTMAFLAVLKEGFETSVFLLAAIQASGSSGFYGLAGAVLGIAISVGIGYAIYVGGVKINLGRFFKITGVFLIFVAAGLVMSALRTGHEAGWVNIGQQQVADFSSWMPKNSIQGAFLSGMFGLQSDPRLIEVVGWFAYAVPVLIIFLWPQKWTPTEAAARRKLFASLAAGLTVVAACMALFIPASANQLPGNTVHVTDTAGHPVTVTVTGSGSTRTLTTTGDQDGTNTVTLDSAGSGTASGVDVDIWQKRDALPADQNAGTITLEQLLQLNGGRLPVGLAPDRTPGPFAVQWSGRVEYEAQTSGDALVSAHATSSRVATLTGGGLTGTKTVSAGGRDTDWAVSDDDVARLAAQVNSVDQSRAERALWRIWIPILLLLGALYLAYRAYRSRPAPPSPIERNPDNNEEQGERDAIVTS